MELIKIKYDSLNSESALQMLVDDSVSENLYLEYKQKSDSRSSDLSEEDKKNYADSVSQFANSDGGILIFGIKTEKPNDRAVELKPITDVSNFLRRLQDFSLTAVQPFVDGVESKSLMSDNCSGYVIFYIPKSLKAPHRSMPSREYYKRGQSGKYRLEHFDLEDMFGRRQKPLLSLALSCYEKLPISFLKDTDKRDQYTNSVKFNILIQNEGRYIGKNVMVIIECGNYDFSIEIKGLNEGSTEIKDISYLRGRGFQSFQIKCPSTIFYPEMMTNVASLYIKTIKRKFDSNSTVKINWSIHAEDAKTHKGSGEIDLKEYINMST